MPAENLHQLLQETEPDLLLILPFAPSDCSHKICAVFIIFFDCYYTCSTSNEAILAKIKLTWWRERLEEILQGKTPRPHPALLELNQNLSALSQLKEIIDIFEDFVDGNSPKNLAEIEQFVSKTFGKAFEIAAQICNSQNGQIYGTGFGFAFLLKKLELNSKQLGTNALPKEQVTQHFLQQLDLLNLSKKSAITILIGHYKNTKKPKRWKLILALLVKAKTLF